MTVAELCAPGAVAPSRPFDRLAHAWLPWTEPWPIRAPHADWGHALAACGQRPVARLAWQLARALRPSMSSADLAPLVDDALACVAAWVERPDEAHVRRASRLADELYFDWGDVKYARYELDGDCPRRPLDAIAIMLRAVEGADALPQVAAATLAIAEEQGLREALLADLARWATET